MLFAASGVETSLFFPPLVAFCVSFVTSMGGVSGAFLLLPFQVSVLGYSTPSVSATNQLFNIVAIPGGVYRYLREGRMVWPLTWVVVLGTLPGVFAGAVIRVRWLPDPSHFKLFAASVLVWIGLRLCRDLLGGAARGSDGDATRRCPGDSAGTRQREREECPPSATVRILHFGLRRIRYAFHGECYDFSTTGIFALSLVVGIVGGVYGIGGGSIIAPFLVTVFGLPVYTVAGAALMGTFVTSVAGVAFYQMIAPFYPQQAIAPDWALGMLFGLGGIAGMYLGARCQKHVPAKSIKWMLAAVILGTATKYVLDFFR